ncbi:MAG: hypothetical protein M9964_09720 [Solirubrobacterales bacterium]|nr:hypothetical protein [Solirubrobacterales bacterium]
MSEEEHDPQEDPGESAVRMRRSLLGYNRADVERALSERDEAVDALGGELDAREAELSELRQDVAALWLAFAQHDRMLRALQGTEPSPTPAPADDGDPATERSGAPEPDEPPAPEPPSVGNQLAELDEVLAAIEMATQTLERTYADEIAEGAAAQDIEGEPAPEPAGPEEDPAEAGPDPEQRDPDASGGD